MKKFIGFFISTIFCFSIANSMQNPKQSAQEPFQASSSYLGNRDIFEMYSSEPCGFYEDLRDCFFKEIKLQSPTEAAALKEYLIKVYTMCKNGFKFSENYWQFEILDMSDFILIRNLIDPEIINTCKLVSFVLNENDVDLGNIVLDGKTFQLRGSVPIDGEIEFRAIKCFSGMVSCCCLLKIIMKLECFVQQFEIVLEKYHRFDKNFKVTSMEDFSFKLKKLFVPQTGLNFNILLALEAQRCAELILNRL